MPDYISDGFDWIQKPHKGRIRPPEKEKKSENPAELSYKNFTLVSPERWVPLVRDLLEISLPRLCPIG